MIDPRQFEVNDAWAVFRVSENPIRTTDGDVNSLALIDVRSNFIFGAVVIKEDSGGISADQAEKLLGLGVKKAMGAMPKVVIIPNDPLMENIVSKSKAIGVLVSRVSSEELLPVTGEALRQFGRAFEPYTS